MALCGLCGVRPHIFLPRCVRARSITTRPPIISTRSEARLMCAVFRGSVLIRCPVRLEHTRNRRCSIIIAVVGTQKSAIIICMYGCWSLYIDTIFTYARGQNLNKNLFVCGCVWLRLEDVPSRNQPVPSGWHTRTETARPRLFLIINGLPSLMSGADGRVKVSRKELANISSVAFFLLSCGLCMCCFDILYTI